MGFSVFKKAQKEYTLASQDQITKAFKNNDIHGRENHLVKVQGVSNYEVPSKDSPQLEDPLKKKKKRKSKGQ